MPNINITDLEEVKSFEDLQELDLGFEKDPMCVVTLERGGEESRHLYGALAGMFRGRLLDSETNYAPALVERLNEGRRLLQDAERTGNQDVIKNARERYEASRQEALDTVVGATMAPNDDVRVYKIKLHPLMQTAANIDNMFLQEARRGLRINPELSSEDHVKSTEKLLDTMLQAAKQGIRSELAKERTIAREAVATGMIEFFPEEEGLVRA